MNLNRAAAALARRPPVSLLRSRALSNSSLPLLAKSYQLPTIVLGTAAEADIAALCERASASAFFRQGMPLVLDYAACDAEPLCTAFSTKENLCVLSVAPSPANGPTPTLHEQRSPLRVHKPSY